MKKTGGAEALFATVGTVIGAGFVSGRELLQFFGCFRLTDLAAAWLFFFGGFFLFFRLGKEYGGFEGALSGIFGRFAPAVKGILFFGSFVSCAGMLSAANALVSEAAPFLALLFLAIACMVSEKGIAGIGKVSLIFVPVLLLSVALLIFSRGALSRPELPALPLPAVCSVALYAGMNVFLSMPVLCELGARMQGKCSLLAGASAFVVALAAGLVLSAVCSDKNSYPCNLPLAYVLEGTRLFRPLAAAGILISLLSAFYPLYSAAGEKWGTAGKISLAATALAGSFVPFGKIVALVYPALGAAGAAAVVFSVAVCVLRRISRAREKRGKSVKLYIKRKKEF